MKIQTPKIPFLYWIIITILQKYPYAPVLDYSHND